MPRVHLEFVIENLPAGFDALREEAQVESLRHVERLAPDWVSLRSKRLLAAHLNGVLAGIGGLIEPVVPGAFRVRRFYFRPPFRRAGISRKLAAALLERAARAGRPVTVNAASGNAAFWEALGFRPDRRDGHTPQIGLEQACLTDSRRASVSASGSAFTTTAGRTRPWATSFRRRRGRPR